METSLSSEDDVLLATARAARQIGLLPGAPTPDWAARLARVLTEADPATSAEVVVASEGAAGPMFECRGFSSGRWVGRSEGGADRARRRLVRALSTVLVGSARQGVWTVDETLGLEGEGARRVGAEHSGGLVAWIPVAREGFGARRALLALWEAPAAPLGLGVEARRRVLRSLSPLIGERVWQAVGGTAGKGSWLSVCEQRVLELLTAGLTVQEIADRLGRSQHTIHDHVKRIHRKLGTRSRGSLIARSLGAWESARPTGSTVAFPAVGRGSYVHHGGW